MAKDFTKYQIEGIAENLNKARLVQKVVTHYCDNENPDFEDLKLTWFDDLQGGKGVVRLLSEVDEKNARNYYVDAPIQLKDGSVVVVCNQWGKDNLANFVYLAGFHGYKIYAEGENGELNNEVENKEVNSNESLKRTSESKEDLSIVSGSPNWGLPESIAFIVRHAIISDNEVLEEELNWMHVAFKEFEKEHIDVRSAWDLVDEQAQLYSKMGYYDNMFSNVISFLNINLSKNQKSDLLAILMEICSADGIIRHSEYVTLMVIAGVFYPGKERSVILEPFMKAGLKIEGVEIENQNNTDSQLLPDPIKKNLTEEDNVDENIFFIYNYVKEFEHNQDELEKLYLNIIKYKPNAQIAGQYAQELFQMGKIDSANQIIQNKSQYEGDDFSWEIFEDAEKEISSNSSIINEKPIKKANDLQAQDIELDERLSSLLEEVINEQDSFMQAFSLEHFDKSGIDKQSYEKFAFAVLNHTSNCWIAGILAMNLFELGNYHAALKIVEDSESYDIQEEDEFRKFESVKKEIQAIESSNFKSLRKSADEDFEVRFNFWGAFCNVYLCAKESGEDIENIESHYEKAVDSYFSFDNDVMFSIEINGNKIFQGEIKQLQIDNNSITEIDSYDEIIHQLAWQRLVRFRNHQSIDDRFDDISKYVSAKNGVITLADNINENRKDDCAPDFDNRYSMVEYGKWFLKTYPIKVKSFDITDFAFIKSKDLEDMMPSAEGSEYCFSKIVHNEKGELEFEVDSNSVKSQDFCEGWPSDY